jgi:hypothetical protein
LKTPLKDFRYDSREDIMQNATAQLHTEVFPVMEGRLG